MVQLKRVVMGIVVSGAVALLVACGGTTANGPAPTATATAIPTKAASPTATATSVPSVAPSPTPTATATPTPTPTKAAAAASPTATAPSADAALLAQGKFVFEKKAGNMGCQACHGMDAKGLVGSNIRGKTADDIRDAMGRVELMVQTIKNLDASDIEAVAAYLKYLATQP